MRAVLLVAAFLHDSSLAASPAAVLAKPVSLLHQGSATASAVSAHSDATASGPLHEKMRPVNPKPSGHMLTDTELKPVNSVRCLEGKQDDPTHNCSDPMPAGFETNARHLNAGNYPSWKDARCHNNGEYFCDPDDLLSVGERKEIAATMKSLRDRSKITCGPQLQHDPVDKWHYEPFHLGVAIAKDWPLHESDANSLQSFGRILAGRWNMTYVWNGNPAFYARCPNEAMLIILPEKRQAYLSSPSCMFICGDKGAPEVATATLLGLDSHGLSEGVSAGVAEVYKVIAKSSPMHAPGWEPEEPTAATWNFRNKAATTGGDGQYASSNWQQILWNYAQRALFVITVLMLIGSVVVMILVLCMAPGMAKDLNKPVV